MSLRTDVSDLGIFPEEDPGKAFSDFARLCQQVEEAGVLQSRVPRGQAALRIGDYLLALRDAEAALLARPDDAAAWRLHGLASLAILAVAARIITPGPGKAVWTTDREALGMEARRALREAVRLDPADAEARDALHVLDRLARLRTRTMSDT